jgi:hypothetical protein
MAKSTVKGAFFTIIGWETGFPPVDRALETVFDPFRDW